MVDEQNHNRPNDGHYQTIEVQTGYACETEHESEPATNNRTDYAEQHIENHSLSTMIDKVAGNETRQQSQ